MEFPSEIKIGAIESTHPHYCGETLANYDALYVGGNAFRDRKDQFVVKRRAETDGAHASQHYADRVKRLHYVNRARGLINWLVAAVCQPSPPRITVPADLPEESSAYWLSLNDDADGLGTPLAALFRRSLRNGMVSGRSYYHMYFPGAIDGQAVAYDSDSMAAYMRPIDGMMVDDWQDDEFGALTWLRVHGVEMVRSGSEIGKADTERHTWTYITKSETATYEALKRDRNWIAGPDKKVYARLISNRPHEMGILPCVRVNAPECNWVMDAISDVVIALLNADLDRAFALAQQCYAQPVFTLENTHADRLKNLIQHENMAIILGPNESYEYVTPPSNVFEPLFKHVTELKADLHEVIQTLAKSAAALPQAGRLSGDAVEAMAKPLNVLLASFAWPDREALQKWVSDVAAFRGESDYDIRVEGLDAFDADIGELKEIINGKAEPDGYGAAVGADGPEQEIE